MTTYRIEAVGNLDATDDTELQAKLDALARILEDGDGEVELGYDWQLSAEEVE